jgi:hypothetical protein
MLKYKLTIGGDGKDKNPPPPPPPPPAGMRKAKKK